MPGKAAVLPSVKTTPECKKTVEDACQSVHLQYKGSKVAIYLNEEVALVHAPHPHPYMDKGSVKSVREFLENAGVRPV